MSFSSFTLTAEMFLRKANPAQLHVVVDIAEGRDDARDVGGINVKIYASTPFKLFFFFFQDQDEAIWNLLMTRSGRLISNLSIKTNHARPPFRKRITKQEANPQKNQSQPPVSFFCVCLLMRYREPAGSPRVIYKIGFSHHSRNFIQILKKIPK